jgi:hypothetical protein
VGDLQLVLHRYLSDALDKLINPVEPVGVEPRFLLAKEMCYPYTASPKFETALTGEFSVSADLHLVSARCSLR